jgi:amino acid transporter
MSERATKMPLAPSKLTTATSANSAAKLSGKMGAVPLALAVLAFAAPLVSVSGYLPPTLVSGGVGATFAFVLATIIMLLFAVGYATMTRHVPAVGGFYAYISAGLGKVTGLGAATLSTVSYLMILADVYAFFGVTVQNLVSSLGGMTMPWWLWSAAGWAIVSVLGYFNVDLSVRIMSVAMAIEVLIVVIFSVTVLSKGGSNGLSAAPFNPVELAHGDIPVTLLFAVLVYLGFEGTALYRNEVRDPERTIPRATYGAVIFIGLLYVAGIYALTTAWGPKAVEEAKNHPADMFYSAAGTFVGPVFERAALLFVITSLLASLLSIHNVVTRYVHNLANDSILPPALGRVHIKHRSPFAASITVSIAVLVGTVPFVVSGTDPELLYVQLAGLGSVGIIFLMGLVSLAVIMWFARNRTSVKSNVFTSVIAPVLSTVSLGYVVVFSLLHFDLIVGGKPGQNTALMAILLGSFAAGIAFALYLKFRRSTKLDQLESFDS